MLYICIPTYNENATIGVLLWRIRKVFQSYSREYEILVYDDGSTDETRETLKPYADVTPLTVIGEKSRRGYGHAIEKLAREVSRRTKYPRRDAMIVMQADFTDQPEQLPEIVKRFEGGADIVVAERGDGVAPVPVRRLRKLAPLALKFLVPVTGIDDPFSSYRLFRISLLRELIKSVGEKPLLASDGWAANVELLMHTVPLARRLENVVLPPRYDLRMRESRIRPFADAMAMYRFGRSAGGRSIVAPAVAAPSASVATAPSARTRQQATS